MTAIAMNYVVNPFKGFWKGFMVTCDIMGYSRAASELARLGYYEEAKNCMMQIKSLRNK